MRTYKRMVALGMAAASLLTLTNGCAGGGDAGSAAGDGPANATKEAVKPFELSKNPVTIKVYHKGGSLSDEEFASYFVAPVKQKYPQITLELVRSTVSPQDLLASNAFPDIIYTSTPSIPIFQDLNIVEDLAPLIKRHNLDLSRFQPLGMEMIKAFDPAKTVGIPITMNVGALMYNKDIFDRFAVEYPKDNLSWDDLLPVAKKLTRTEAGETYIGFDPYRIDFAGSQMSLPFVDPKTNKAVLNTEGWNRVYTIFKQFLEIPGYVNNKKFDYDFFKDNLAMSTVWAADLSVYAKSTDQAIVKRQNWDLLTHPYFKGFEGKGRSVDSHLLIVSSLSENKDAAFKVIQEVVSDEVQMMMAKSGRLSPLKDESYQKNYLQDLAVMKGKNLSALFKMSPAPLPAPTKYDNSVRLIARGVKQKMATTPSKDVNTLLREAQEEAEKLILAESQTK